MLKHQHPVYYQGVIIFLQVGLCECFLVVGTGTTVRTAVDTIMNTRIRQKPTFNKAKKKRKTMEIKGKKKKVMESKEKREEKKRDKKRQKSQDNKKKRKDKRKKRHTILIDIRP